MLEFLALLLIGGMLALPSVFDNPDNSPTDDSDRDNPERAIHEPETEGPGAPSSELVNNPTLDALVDEIGLNFEQSLVAPIGPRQEQELEKLPEVTITTDPDTGAVDIIVQPDAKGHLVAVFQESSVIPYNEASSGGRAYGLTLLWVPEGVHFESEANRNDWESFFSANEEVGIEPSRSMFFADIGVKLVAHWDLGERSFIDSALGDWPYAQDRFDSRILLPEITANSEIAWYEVSGNGSLSDLMSVNALELKPVEGPNDITFNFDVSVESFPEGQLTNGYVERFSPKDGDVILGTEFDDYIDNPPGDPTAIIVMGGAGSDKITSGLNDTIVTNDDQDADTIYVRSPASMAEVYDAVPIIQAGAEDTIEIAGDSCFVITFAQIQGNGMTAYFFHIVSAPNGFQFPNTLLSYQDDPLTLREYYVTIGAELMAQGSLGSVGLIDGENVIDTRIIAPQFSGKNIDFLSATLIGDAVLASTAFTPATSVNAFG